MARKCPGCDAALTDAEVSGGWCESCGKRLPASMATGGTSRVGGPAPRPEEDARKQPPSILWTVLLFIWGGVGIERGVSSLLVMRGVQAQPSHVRLEDLEAGQAPPQNHVTLGEHYRVYPLCLFYARLDSGDDPSIKSVLVPVCSTGHPLLGAWPKALADKGLSPPERPRVFVRSEAFRRQSEIPMLATPLQSELTGLVVTGLDGLNAEERRLIRDAWPGWDQGNVIIVQEGGTPGRLQRGVLMIPIGLALMLWGVWNVRRLVSHYRRAREA